MTEQNFIDNINNKILTEEMIALTVHSYSKRAKNYRAIEYDLKEKEATEEEIELIVKQKKALYKRKAIVLSALQPIAIHMENHVQAKDEMFKIFEGKENNTETIFEDENYYGCSIRYYLAYKANGHTFHTPIKDYELDKYKYRDIPIINVGNLYSKGEDDLDNLLPLKYCEMVYNMVKSKKYNLKR